MDPDKLVSRAALGNVASLGDLYDARTDNFVGNSIFKSVIPDAALTQSDNNFPVIQLMHGDTLTEKFNRMDVNPELQVSVLAGLVKLEGPGQFLHDNKNSSHSVKSSLLYNIRTKDENLNIFHAELKDAFEHEIIESGVATHVVVGITWGANTVVSLEYINTENRDIKEIEESLSAHLNKLSLSISCKADFELNEEENGKRIKFVIRMYGDVFTKNQDLPTTFDGVLNFMKKMPSIVATCNDGRGMPFKYYLLPLTFLQNYCKLNMKADFFVKYLQKQTLVRILDLCEKFTVAKQKLNDFIKDPTENAATDDNFSEILSISKKIDIEGEKFRHDLGKMLSAVRSNKAEENQLEDLIHEFKSSECSLNSVDTTLRVAREIQKKPDFIKSLTDNGVLYIGFGASLDESIIKDLDIKSYILYFTEEATRANSEIWQSNLEALIQEAQKHPEFKYFAVDCDIHEKLWPEIGISIQVLQNGKVFSENFVEYLELQKELQIPTAKCSADMKLGILKPNKRIPLTIKCTGKDCDRWPEYGWKCGKCKGIIEYGFDEFFYCQCGRGPVSLYEFRCPDPKHGVTFQHEYDYLTQLLKELKPLKEINILIMGETGVGKSTWINGFINFLTYESLQEAEKHPLCFLIPSEFTVCDENFKCIKVQTGTDDNECQNAGQSATQECKVYPFVIGDTMIRLIDTPGIGDTRGVEQDKKNFQNILSTLSHFTELHGICILLKPNNARLTVMFRFCIKELLTYLHKDASHNIMFCFTNSRGTFYRPGDTLPALKKLLEGNKDVKIPISKETVYCYDSEAYRFLAAIKNPGHPVKFNNFERDNFVKSWSESLNETKRMIKRITELNPHPIQNTLNLNHVREIVLQLTRPMAEISKNIAINKEVIKDHIKDIERTEENIKELEKKKFFNIRELEIITLTYPKTVCTNSKCTTVFGDNDFKQIEYRTVCHDHCQLTGVNSDVVGHPGLIRCWAITKTLNGCCRICGHHYKMHMHIYYDSREVDKQVESKTVKQQLIDNLTAAELKKKMIEEHQNRIKENDKEQAVIEAASIKFAGFLKHNAITPYNDAMLEYMDHLINEEKKKILIGGSKRTLEAMLLSRSSYEQQTKILDTEMARGGANSVMLQPAEIDALVKGLYRLKHNGNTIKESLNAVRTTKSQISQYQEFFSQNKPRKKKITWKKFTDWNL